MTDELENTGDRALTRDEVLAATEANYNNMREFADNIPKSLEISRDLAYFYAVHIDERGQMLPDQDPLNVQFFSAIVQLEGRLVRVETALRDAGLLKD